MTQRLLAAIVAASLLVGPVAAARADNQMGYRLLTAQEASGLPHNHGALGLDVERATTITDAGMSFDLIRVKSARSGGAGTQAGLRRGDEIIALDGRVFQSLAAFAAYVGAAAPKSRVVIDYIPSGGGPAQAQRVTAVIGSGAGTGMSTREKVAIGVGAAALLGCYEMGCFNRNQPPQPQAQPGQIPQPR